MLGQGVPAATFVLSQSPVEALQSSAVQALPSSWQVLAVFLQPMAGSHVSLVQALPSSHMYW